MNVCAFGRRMVLSMPVVQSVHPFGLCFMIKLVGSLLGYTRITRQAVPRLIGKEVLYHIY